MNFEKRVYTFTARAVINGEAGPVHIERIEKPVKTCPEATTRVIARFQGRVRNGTPIEVNGDAMVILRMYPSNERVKVAHFLCAAAGTPRI